MGTAKHPEKGMLIPCYTAQIEATSELIKAHKFSYLIISGDHGTENYNKPPMMKDDQMKLGVDTGKIFQDNT